MAKKSVKKSTLDNGLNSFCMHRSDAGSKKAMSALTDERAASARFAFAAGVTAKSLDPETIAQAYLQQALASDAVPKFTAPVVREAESEYKSIGTEAKESERFCQAAVEL